MSKRRSRRQRKKLRVGEFQELGFWVSANLADGLDEAAKVSACDEFFADCIEANRLTYGGAIDDHLDGFVCPEGDRNSATEEDRQSVLNWLNQRTEFNAVQVGSLEDAWYGIGAGHL